MKRIILILTVVFLLSGCLIPDKTDLNVEEIVEIIKNENDSLLSILDSLMNLNFELPLLIDSNYVSIECINTFSKLARETNGEIKVLTNSGLINKAIIDVINSHASDNADIMFLIDKTGSMRDDIDNIKKGLNNILKSIEGFKNTRLSIGMYGDKNTDGDNWFEFKNFDKDFVKATNFIKSIQVSHGGDAPESVYDGIYQAFQEGFFRSDSKRIVVLIGDAPPLGSDLSTYNLNDIVEFSKKEKININFYPIVLSPYEISAYESSIIRMTNVNYIENIYPVPSSGVVSLQLNNSDNLFVEVIDNSGQILKSFKTFKNLERVDLNDLQNGVYVIRVFDFYKNFDSRKIILNK